jgi:hypothetical protein
VRDPNESAQVKGFSLVEIVGRDLLTWRLVHDARPSHVCVIDSAHISEICLVDEAGPILAVETRQNQWRTVTSFEAHSPVYTMIYWRYGFVEEDAGQCHLTDKWHAVEPRVFLWAFPPGIVLDDLQPPALRAALSTWEDRLIATAVGVRLTAEARYHTPAPGETPTMGRATAPPNIKTLTALMPPTPALARVLEQTRLRCATSDLLRNSHLIKHLVGL